MIARLGFLVAASVAAFTVKQLNVKATKSSDSSAKPSGKRMEEREVKLEGELLEYYALKEREPDIVELQRQLKIKTVEIDMLNITINSLQAERKKLQEEILLELLQGGIGTVKEQDKGAAKANSA
ncbi:CHLOROPLAST UNUSUAL POSITIONING protein [Salix suchowensis]|nr:CHLOROPLAST UNUSUAL POSITIONING protein [Salix suchowensis]